VIVAKPNGRDARSQDVQAWIIEVLERRADAKKQLDELRNLREAGGRASDERRLAVYQAARDTGLVPASAGYHAVAITLLHIAERVTEEDPRLRDLMQQMEAVRQAHNGDWKEGEGPEDYESLRREWHQIADAIPPAIFRAHGELEMADLCEADREEFSRRVEAAGDDWRRGER
jgi:hypothetical protein